MLRIINFINKRNRLLRLNDEYIELETNPSKTATINDLIHSPRAFI